jgi:hypothetical protein
MDSPIEVVELQLKTQQVIDLCRGGQAQPHILYSFLIELDTNEQRKVALRLVQKVLEQTK